MPQSLRRTLLIGDPVARVAPGCEELREHQSETPRALRVLEQTAPDTGSATPPHDE